MVHSVTFRDNRFTNITKTGIEVVQNYDNGGSYENREASSNAPFSQVTYENNTGTVANRRKANRFTLNCSPGACDGFIWKASSVTGGGKPDVCVHAPQSMPCGAGTHNA